MVTLTSFTSGSCGNAFYLDTGKTKILVDAGVPLKYLKAGLKTVGARLEELTAVLITHEHSDHISALPVIARRLPRLPVYVSIQLAAARPALFVDTNLRVFPVGDFFSVGDIDVQAFDVSHDSAAAVGFSFYRGRHKICLATDLGEVTPPVAEALSGYDALLLEANHDPDMLEQGRYPYFLKKRISGRFGHLSNYDAAALLLRLINGRAQHVLLGHMSDENNTPETAYGTVAAALREAGVDSATIGLAPRRRQSEVVRLS